MHTYQVSTPSNNIAKGSNIMNYHRSGKLKYLKVTFIDGY